jgi:hypothetical protein
MESHDPIEPIESQEPFDAAVTDEPLPAAKDNAWLTPAKVPVAYAPSATTAPMYDLRPLTLGEVLDRTFSVYRSRFWLFAGIAAISGAVQLIAAAAQMVFQHRTLHHAQFGKIDVANMIAIVLGNLLFFLVYSVTQAATVFAVSEVYLGRVTTIEESLRATIGRWLAYVGIAFWQLGSFMWVPTLMIVPAIIIMRLLPKNPGMLILGVLMMLAGVLGGSVLGVILLLRNMLAVPAAVVEKLKVRASMRRSKVLAAGTKGRLFVVGLISYCLYMIVGVLQAPLAMLVFFAIKKGHESVAAQAGMLLIGFLGHSVVTPVAMIGFTLVYFDQRVRKEAFDIAVLLGEDQPVVASVLLVEQTPVVDEPAEGQAGDGIAL